MSNKTLIVIQPQLGVGGIEDYFVKLMAGCVRLGCKVYWLCDSDRYVYCGYKQEMAGVEVVPFRSEHLHRLRTIKVPIEPDSEVAIVCAYSKFLIYAEELIEKQKLRNANAFYLMPHFEGYKQFPEEAFRGRLNRYIGNRYKKIIDCWIQRNQILFFAKKHALVLQEHYSLAIPDVDKRLVPSVWESPRFDLEKTNKKARGRSSMFLIATAARFEFPHKGYIIGLIHAFSKLLESFPQVKLLLIGDGPNRNEIEECVNQQNAATRDAIELKGYLSPTELERELGLAQLNIGVAGSLLAGARRGTLSLPVRHYTYELESPGYLSCSSDEGSLVVSPCEDAYSYIENAITMPDSDYCRLSYDSYLAAIPEPPDYYYFFTHSNKRSIDALSKSERRFTKIVFRIANAVTFIKTRHGRE